MGENEILTQTDKTSADLELQMRLIDLIFAMREARTDIPS